MIYMIFVLTFFSAHQASAFSLFSYDRTKTETERPEPNKTRLNAIYYTDKDHWAFWLGTQKVTSDNCPDTIVVNDICEDWVDFSYNGEHHRLKVNQGF